MSSEKENEHKNQSVMAQINTTTYTFNIECVAKIKKESVQVNKTKRTKIKSTDSKSPIIAVKNEYEIPNRLKYKKKKTQKKRLQSSVMM